MPCGTSRRAQSVVKQITYLAPTQQPHFAMITKLITIPAILLMVLGCNSRDIRETHLITDLSKPITLTFKLKSGNADAGYKIKGYINGTAGYSEGLFFNDGSNEFPPFPVADNLVQLDSAVIRKYVRIYSDSINSESSSSIGQKGLVLGLHFTPGTATKGKIEVEFWEHPIGIY
jgi:hypothetical protein